MGTEYCGLITTSEDRQECFTAVDYITAVVEHDCAGSESEFCAAYWETGDFSIHFFALPLDIQSDVAETFVNAFGFEDSEIPAAFDSIISLQGLSPHTIFSAELQAIHLPADWPLESVSPEGEAEDSEASISYSPTGWATLFDISLETLAFRESDGIDARVATRFSAAYYFDVGLFASGGFEFITTFAENTGVFNFDLAIEGGYYQAILDHFGLEFFARLNLGYMMSKGSIAADGAAPVEISSFDAGVGSGVRAMIPLLDEPFKSNMPSFFVGAEYLWRLHDGHQLLLSIGTLFNFI